VRPRQGNSNGYFESVNNPYLAKIKLKNEANVAAAIEHLVCLFLSWDLFSLLMDFSFVLFVLLQVRPPSSTYMCVDNESLFLHF
jgi:hypothetical protein